MAISFGMTLIRPNAECASPARFLAGAAVQMCLAFALAVTCLSATPRAQAQSPPPQSGSVILVEIRGAIGFVAASQLDKALDLAAKKQAPAVIVRLDTPGGLLTSTREMIQAILAARVPVVMYVAPSGSRAASAGTYLVYASHIAAMAPGTHLGAATPVSLAPGLPGSPPPSKPSESDKDGKKDGATAMERKVVNDAVAYIRTLAELRGRNADWAEKAVREAATLTASAALKEGVIDVIATDVNDLLTKIDGRTVETTAGKITLQTKGLTVDEIKPDWKTRLMSTITDPNIAIILLMIGFYGILFEFWNPGVLVPGVVGAISLILAFTALAVLPVNYAGLGLLLLGIALMAFEAFSPGFGIAGLGGLVAFALGALFLFDPDQADIPIHVSWQVVAALTGMTAIFFAGILAFAARARTRPVRTGMERIPGSTGEVVNWAGTSGQIRMEGDLWNAQSTRPLNKGQKVVVLDRTGLTLIVEPSTP